MRPTNLALRAHGAASRARARAPCAADRSPPPACAAPPPRAPHSRRGWTRGAPPPPAAAPRRAARRRPWRRAPPRGRRAALCAARRWQPRSDLRLHLGSLEPRQHLRHHALAQIALAYPPAQIHVDLAVHLLVQLAQPPLLAFALLLLPPILAQHVAPLALANSLLLLRDEAETHAVAGLAFLNEGLGRRATAVPLFGFGGQAVSARILGPNPPHRLAAGWLGLRRAFALSLAHG